MQAMLGRPTDNAKPVSRSPLSMADASWRMPLCGCVAVLLIHQGLIRTSLPAAFMPVLASFLDPVMRGLGLLLGGFALFRLLGKRRVEVLQSGVPEERSSAELSDAAEHSAYATRRAQQDQSAIIPSVAEPREWSLELLHRIDWRRFEDLCLAYFRARDITAYSTPISGDGRMDIRLHEDEFDAERCTAIIHCKALGAHFVGAEPLRELREVMLRERIAKAIFMVPGKFSHEARHFAAENHITLIDGTLFLAMLKRLPVELGDRLLHNICRGAWRIPTCPGCGVKMIQRRDDRTAVWVCSNYPRCRQVLAVRAERPVA